MECLGLDYPCVLLGKWWLGEEAVIPLRIRALTVSVNGLDNAFLPEALVNHGWGGQHLRPVGLNQTWFLLFWWLCSLCRGAPCKERCSVQRK